MAIGYGRFTWGDSGEGRISFSTLHLFFFFFSCLFFFLFGNGFYIFSLLGNNFSGSPFGFKAEQQ